MKLTMRVWLRSGVCLECAEDVFDMGRDMCSVYAERIENNIKNAMAGGIHGHINIGETTIRLDEIVAYTAPALKEENE